VLGREPEHREAQVLLDRFRSRLKEGRRASPSATRSPPEASTESPLQEERVTHHDPAVAVHEPGEPHSSRAVNADPGVAIPETLAEARPPGALATPPAGRLEKPVAASEGFLTTRDREVAAGELPDRYDVDEVVALAVDPTTVYLY